jgi:hypothetical protein
MSFPISVFISAFATLVALFFLPPLLLAFGVQVWFARQRGQLRAWRLIIAFFATTVLSLVVSYPLLDFALRQFGVPIVSSSLAVWVPDSIDLPISPLAFVAVAIAAPIVTFLVFVCGKKKASQETRT